MLRIDDVEIMPDVHRVAPDVPCVVVTGLYADCYGWWHRHSLRLDAVAPVGTKGRPLALPEPFALTLTQDPYGRGPRVCVPDHVADRLIEWRDATWTELVGCAAGHSGLAALGSDEHRALAWLHAVIDQRLVDKHPIIQGLSHSRETQLLVSTFGVSSPAPNQFQITG